jgi:hypothetical protein
VCLPSIFRIISASPRHNLHMKPKFYCMGSVKVDSKRQHTGWEDILHHPVYCVFLTGW